MAITNNLPKKKQILVVEDDEFNRNIYSFKLVKEGYVVIISLDGDSALSEAKKKKPDLILLDLMMLGKDGFETLEEIKKDKNLKDIKVIVFSNLGQQEDIDRAKKLGAEEYLVKADTSINQVVDLIKKYTK